MAPLVLGAWLHDLNPFILQISDGFGVRWYGTAYAAGFVVAYALLRWLHRRGVTPLTPQQIADSMMVLCLGVVLGGRLGYVVFYDPALLWTFSTHAPWWNVLMLNHGGMSSHGGMLGVLAACWWVWRGLRTQPGGGVPLLHVMDLTALVCTPGLFFGRLANFVNGELLGDIVAPPGAPGPWWAVKFPQERFTNMEPLLDASQQQQLLKLLETYRVGRESDEAAYDRVVHLLQQGGKTATDIGATLSPLISSRHPSQLYQAACEGLVLGLCLLLAWRAPRKPGFIVACFLAFYGVMRVLTELYRLPDANLAVQRVLGLSRGQWLSLIMVAFGLLCFRLASRRSERFGGWAAKRA
jgi:phosphatidylglycerol---prolipoprotein diacylglyceryl transferase